MSKVTNTDPVVTESKLTEFYEDIKPFLGCPAYVTQEGDAEYYSTDEKVIGRWIDGKPIYQKTWTGLNYTIGTSWVSLSAIVSNGYCDRVLNGFGSRADGSLIPLVVYVPNGDVQVVAAQSSFGEVTEISLTYTKTADSAVTTIETKPTHYSTDEQVVGTWIDNKPIYQKTFSQTITFTQSRSWSTIATGLATLNIDRVVSLVGNIEDKYTSDTYYSNVPFDDGSTYACVNFSKQNGTINLVTSGGGGMSVVAYITIQYTKNSD